MYLQNESWNSCGVGGRVARGESLRLLPEPCANVEVARMPAANATVTTNNLSAKRIEFIPFNHLGAVRSCWISRGAWQGASGEASGDERRTIVFAQNWHRSGDSGARRAQGLAASENSKNVRYNPEVA